LNGTLYKSFSSLIPKGFTKYAVEMASCGIIYLPSFMKIGIGVQAILRIVLRILRGCDVGITDGRIYNIRR
jgi:hypothetical protein